MFNFIIVNMQRFITFVIILDFISTCLCTKLNVGAKNVVYNVMDYGAHGDGKSDDTQVYMSLFIYFFNLGICH
jgi:hypothetical protein